MELKSWQLIRRMLSKILVNHPAKDINKQIMLIKTVPDPTLMCEGCVFDGKFECLKMACCADPNNPVKYIEVEE